MLNLLDPQRVRLGTSMADYQPVANDSPHLEKGDSLSLAAVDFEDQLLAPSPRERTAVARVKSGLLGILMIFLPSFFQCGNLERPRRRSNHPTAWLGKSITQQERQIARYANRYKMVYEESRPSSSSGITYHYFSSHGTYIMAGRVPVITSSSYRSYG